MLKTSDRFIVTFVVIVIAAVANPACGGRFHGSPRACATANVSRAASARFPLSVQAGTRYLVDPRGAPFLIQGDSAWSLMAQLTVEDAEAYLENRRQKVSMRCSSI